MMMLHWPWFTWKFLKLFLRKPSCPRNICTEHWRKLPNLIAFLKIYLYLKSKNNDFVKNVSKVLLNVPFIYFSLCKFVKFLMSFLKAQVIFPSNFTSIFSAIKHNSSAFFFCSNIVYFGQRSPLKCKFLRFSSAWVKICQTPHFSFEMTSQFLFRFCIILHCHDT